MRGRRSPPHRLRARARVSRRQASAGSVHDRTGAAADRPAVGRQTARAWPAGRRADCDLHDRARRHPLGTPTSGPPAREVSADASERATSLRDRGTPVTPRTPSPTGSNHARACDAPGVPRRHAGVAGRCCSRRRRCAGPPPCRWPGRTRTGEARGHECLWRGSRHRGHGVRRTHSEGGRPGQHGCRPRLRQRRTPCQPSRAAHWVATFRNNAAHRCPGLVQGVAHIAQRGRSGLSCMDRSSSEHGLDRSSHPGRAPGHPALERVPHARYRTCLRGAPEAPAMHAAINSGLTSERSGNLPITADRRTTHGRQRHAPASCVCRSWPISGAWLRWPSVQPRRRHGQPV